MPAPAVVAGLVVGAVLGTGLLCLGTYFVHRFMDLQCRRISIWFHRNALIVYKSDDVESGGNEKIKQSGERSDSWQRGYEDAKVRNEGGVRGGDEHGDREDEVDWATDRRVQGYAPRATPTRVQPATHSRALGWEQEGVEYDRMWYSPAAFQRAVPGMYYAYVPARSEVTTAYAQPPFRHPGSYDEWCELLESRQEGGVEAERARECPTMDYGAALSARVQAEPAFTERNYVQVVDKCPLIIEEARKERDIKERKTTREQERLGRSSSTDLGTCSSSESSASFEDIPRDSNSSGASYRARCCSYEFTSHPQCLRCPVRVQNNGVPYVQWWSRSEGRRDREEMEDGRRDSRRQASNTLSFHSLRLP